MKSLLVCADNNLANTPSQLAMFDVFEKAQDLAREFVVLRSGLGHVPSKAVDSIRDGRNRVDSNVQELVNEHNIRANIGSGDGGSKMFARSTSGFMDS